MTKDWFRVHHQTRVRCGKTKQRVRSLKFAGFHNQSPPLTMASKTPGLCCAFNIPSATLPSLRTFLLTCFVCFASQTPGLCSALNSPSAPLPSLHTFCLSYFVCFALQTPGLCSAFNSPVAALHSLHTFCLSYFVCFALKTPGLCSAFNIHSAPYPVWARFISHLLCASPHKHRVCVVLLISLTQFAHVLFVMFCVLRLTNTGLV